MTDASTTTVTKSKVTALQVENDCPDRLQEIGRQIAARIEKIDKQIVQAENHSISINQLIAKAKELCDEGGFNAFQKKFFPDLGKSRFYELLAIGTNKKTVEEIRASNRLRVAKHRANKAATSNSVTVTEKSEPLDAPTDTDAAEATRTTTAPTKPPSLAKRMALVDFSATVRELVRVTSNKRAERFAQTSVTADDLARLGELLTDIANIKKFEAAKAPVTALPDNGDVSTEQTAEDMKANAALEASVDPVA
jgi:hypothetical protein